MVFQALVALALTVLLFAEGTPAERFLSRILVQRLIAVLRKVTLGRALVTAAMIFFAAGVVWLGGNDGLAVLTYGAPELAGWLTTFEIASYVDALAFAVAASTLIRWRGIVTALRGAFHRTLGLRRIGGRRMRHRPRNRVPADNDDDDGEDVRLAA